MTDGPSSSEDVNSAAVLRDVSDTALWVAVYRARETERRHPLFRDPYARLLAGERGQRIVRALPRGRPSWPLVIRTAVFDELILRTVARDGAACVLNLAAGLDTRPYRLDLPAELRWVEVDLPAILDYKAQLLGGERPRCQVERLAVDLTDGAARRRLLDRVAATGPTLVMCEGLLVYLTREEVAALGRDLAERDDLRWWLLDLVGRPHRRSPAGRGARVLPLWPGGRAGVLPTAGLGARRGSLGVGGGAAARPRALAAAPGLGAQLTAPTRALPERLAVRVPRASIVLST